METVHKASEDMFLQVTIDLLVSWNSWSLVISLESLMSVYSSLVHLSVFELDLPRLKIPHLFLTTHCSGILEPSLILHC